MRCCIFRSRHTARRGYAGRERFDVRRGSNPCERNVFILELELNVNCASAANPRRQLGRRLDTRRGRYVLRCIKGGTG